MPHVPCGSAVVAQAAAPFATPTALQPGMVVPLYWKFAVPPWPGMRAVKVTAWPALKLYDEASMPNDVGSGPVGAVGVVGGGVGVVGGGVGVDGGGVGTVPLTLIVMGPAVPVVY